MFKLIYHALSDLYKFHFGEKTDGYAYAFIVHPRDNTDVYRKYPFLRFLPESALIFFLEHMWPTTVSEITGLVGQDNGKPIKGWLISIPMTAKMMLKERELAVKKILEAVQFAGKRGVKLVAFGALTSSVTNGGLLIKDKIEDIYLTTGHAYTGLNVFENVDSIVQLFNMDKRKLCVVVVGASGSVGSITTELLLEAGYKNILLIEMEKKMSRLTDKVKSLVEKYSDAKINMSTNIRDVHGKDIIVTATNAEEAILMSEYLSPGTVIVDDAQPSDVHHDVLFRKDVLVLEAGVVHTPNISTNFNLGLKHRNDNFCCMAELLVLASHGWEDNFVISRANVEHVVKIKKMRDGLNFRLGDYQNRERKISKEEIQNFFDVIKKEKHSILKADVESKLF